MRYLIPILAFCCASVSAEEIYRCQVDGRTLFSQTPCAADSQPIHVKIHIPSDAEVAEAQTRADARATEVQANLDEAAAKQKVIAAESALRSKEAARDREVGAIRQQRQYANNNLAGMTYLQSLSEQEQAVVERHKEAVEAARRELEAAKSAQAAEK